MGRGKHVGSMRWIKAILSEHGAAWLAEGQRREELRLAREKRRPKCRCKAYPWPHRPGGGLCRHPDPPAQTWKGTPGRNRRPGVRYRGLVKEICRGYKWHPVRDRRKIDRWMSRLYVAYCKRYYRQYYWYLSAEGRIDPHGRLLGVKESLNIAHWDALERAWDRIDTRAGVRHGATAKREHTLGTAAGPVTISCRGGNSKQ